MPRFELTAPDLGRWRTGNTGVQGVWRFHGGAPGPRLAVTALIHGNELCGAWAACGLLEHLHGGTPLQAGVLTVALCNLAAFDRFDAADPDASRCVEEDLNRLWGERASAGRPDSLERRRAAELAPWLHDADFLLDLHSMHEPGPPLLLTGMHSRHVAFARALGVGGHVVIDAGHAEGARLRDHGRFGSAQGQACALLVECGYHGDPRSRRVAEDAVYRLLALTGVLGDALPPAAWRLDQPPAAQALHVTDAIAACTLDFRFVQPFESLAVVARRGTVIAWDRGTPVCTPYDDCVLVMPSLRQLRPGATVVRLARREPL